MEFNITKKEYRNVLLKYHFYSIFIILICAPLGILLAIDEGGKSMFGAIIFFSLFLIMASFISPIIIIRSFNKHWKKDVNEIILLLEREEDNFKLVNKELDKNSINFNVNEIKEIKLFKKFGIILIKQNKKKIQIPIATNDYSKKLKEEVEDRQIKNRSNKRKNKKDKGE